MHPLHTLLRAWIWWFITKRVNQDASYQQCDLTWKRVKAGSIHLTRGDLFKANILYYRESKNWEKVFHNPILPPGQQGVGQAVDRPSQNTTVKNISEHIEWPCPALERCRSLAAVLWPTWTASPHPCALPQNDSGRNAAMLEHNLRLSTSLRIKTNNKAWSPKQLATWTPGHLSIPSLK